MASNEVKEFCEKNYLTIDQFYGKEEIKDDLILTYIKVLPKGFNPTVRDYLDLSSVTELPEDFNPIVGCDLVLRSVNKLPKGFNPTVGGSLNLWSVTQIPEDFNPTVGRSLDLSSVTKIPKGFNPIVGRSLDLSSVTKIPEGFNPTVGCDLNLSSVTELPKDFNTTVGCSLYLNSVTGIPEGFNPKVGGSLYLNSVKELPEGFNPTVGGIIYYNNAYKDINHDLPILSWENGKYISVDDIFCEVLHKKGNIFKCKYLNTDEIFYVVSDGNETYAHGYTIKEAQEDLLFKLSERNIDNYKNLTLDSVLKHDEAVICYRIITGACSFGTNDFLNNVLGENTKESYTIREMIQLTDNQYGNNTFKNFFNV